MNTQNDTNSNNLSESIPSDGGNGYRGYCDVCHQTIVYRTKGNYIERVSPLIHDCGFEHVIFPKETTGQQCDHTMGQAYGADESWLFKLSAWRNNASYVEELFNFCPDCGDSLKELEMPPEVPKEPVSLTESEKRFMEEAGRLSPEIVKTMMQPRPFRDL